MTRNGSGSSGVRFCLVIGTHHIIQMRFHKVQPKFDLNATISQQWYHSNSSNKGAQIYRATWYVSTEGEIKV